MIWKAKKVLRLERFVQVRSPYSISTMARSTRNSNKRSQELSSGLTQEPKKKQQKRGKGPKKNAKSKGPKKNAKSNGTESAGGQATGGANGGQSPDVKSSGSGGAKSGHYTLREKTDIYVNKNNVGLTASMPMEHCGQLLPICTKNGSVDVADSVTVGPEQFFVFGCGMTGRMRGMASHYALQTATRTNKRTGEIESLKNCDVCHAWKTGVDKLVPSTVPLEGPKRKLAFQPHSQEEIDAINLKLADWCSKGCKLKKTKDNDKEEQDDVAKDDVAKDDEAKDDEAEDEYEEDEFAQIDIISAAEIQNLHPGDCFKGFPELPDYLIEFASKAPVRLICQGRDDCEGGEEYNGIDFLLVINNFHGIDCPCGYFSRDMGSVSRHQLDCRHFWVRTKILEVDPTLTRTNQRDIDKKVEKPVLSLEDKEMELKIANAVDRKDRPKKHGERKKKEVDFIIKVIPMSSGEQITAFNNSVDVHRTECGNCLPITKNYTSKYTDPVSTKEGTLKYRKTTINRNGTVASIPIKIGTIPADTHEATVMWVPDHVVKGGMLKDCFESVPCKDYAGPVLLHPFTEEALVVGPAGTIYDCFDIDPVDKEEDLATKPAAKGNENSDHFLIPRQGCLRRVGRRPLAYQELLQDVATKKSNEASNSSEEAKAKDQQGKKKKGKNKKQGTSKSDMDGDMDGDIDGSSNVV